MARRVVTPLALVLTLGLATGLVAAAASDRSAQEQKHAKGRANRLAGESSPYLLMHAHNPVDWYPWGEEAFAKAKAENKPIFLSIGYSSCYWCHVMERGVFSNEEIARFMNENFVNIKLDREERPDLDDIYMTSLIVYLRAVGSRGGGGWPMSMFLLPDGRPFAGGTYFPPKDGPAGTGFPTVARNVLRHWKEQRTSVDRTAELLTAEVRRIMTPQPPEAPVALAPALADAVVDSLHQSFDPVFGGLDFSRVRPDGPKFPVPSRLEFLQYMAREKASKQAAEMVTLTLDRMIAGGIRDHLAGGFHRYSTDRRWHVPHFEKMLYDQSQLAGVLTLAWQDSRKPAYRQAAEEILDYVLSDLTNAEGGFHSALDAETNTIEGEYYVWSREEVDKILGDDAAVFAQAYGMEETNPFEHGFVLHLPRPLDETAKTLKTTSEDLRKRLAGMRQRLLTERRKRESPFLDDKVLTSWNGLMIRALADAGSALESQRYKDAAVRAANFVLSQMVDDKGRLQRTWRGQKAKLNAYLDDYAFFVSGLLAVHRATGEADWLQRAEQFQQLQHSLFWSDKAGGYYFTSHDHEALIARTRNARDAVLPSGNSVSVRNLVALNELTGKPEYREHARRTLEAFAASLESSPGGLAHMALGLQEYLGSQPGNSRLDRSGLEFTTVQSRAPAKSTDDEKKVQAKAYLSVDKLPAGRKARIAVYCKIADHWHINANPANPDFLVPTKFTIKSKYGTKLTNVTYPKYKPLMMEGFDKPSHVYEGTIVIYGTLEVPARAAGRTEELQLIVDYQACKKGTCLRPTKVVLGGKLKVAASGEPIRTINKDKFPKKRTASSKPGEKK